MPKGEAEKYKEEHDRLNEIERHARASHRSMEQICQELKKRGESMKKYNLKIGLRELYNFLDATTSAAILLFTRLRKRKKLLAVAFPTAAAILYLLFYIGYLR